MLSHDDGHMKGTPGGGNSVHESYGRNPGAGLRSGAGMLSRAGRKHEARRRILAAAARQLREQGLGGAGVATVMAEAGLTHGAFYSHFDSKEQLISEALEGSLATARERLLASAGPPGPERRDRALRSYLSPEHRDSPGEGCPLPSTSADVARAPASVRRAYDAKLREVIACFEEELGGLQTEDAHAEGVGMLALCVGSLLLARATPDPALSDDILDSCRRFAGIRKETTRT